MGGLQFALLGGVAALAIGFGSGWKVHDWADAQAQLHQVKHTVQVVQKQAAVTQTVAVQQQAAQDHIKLVYRTIHDQVPHYITVKGDAGCVVPSGFVSLHDDAASGVPPASDAPAVPPDAPSGIELSEVAQTVADNYGICHETGERLKGWQSWWAGVSAVR